jgi:hypothetical protein
VHTDELNAAKCDVNQHTVALQASVQEHRLAVRSITCLQIAATVLTLADQICIT